MSFFKKLGAKVQEGIVRTSDTIEGAHGFSALIETQVEGSEPHTILFDTGPDSKSIIRNVESMQVNTRRYTQCSLPAPTCFKALPNDNGHTREHAHARHPDVIRTAILHHPEKGRKGKNLCFE